jgi:hypothetical protein
MSGLTKTADTGQVDWTAATWGGGTAEDRGFEIYYLNDSLHSTSPIYFRLDFGTGGTTTRPRLKLTVGSGSNGAGVITGTALGAANITSSAAGPIAGTHVSYLCVASGFIGFVGWAGGGAAGVAMMGFIISRTCDTDGTEDSLGAAVLDMNSTSSVAGSGGFQSFRWTATAAAYVRTSTSPPIYIVGAETATIISGNSQVYLGWSLTPYQQPLRNIGGVLTAEIGETSVFSVALIGTSAHTYINIGRELGIQVSAASSTIWSLAMLWE